MPPILKLKKFFEILDTLDENTLEAFQSLNQKEKEQFFNLIKDEDKNKKILNIVDNSKIIKKTLFLKIIKEFS